MEIRAVSPGFAVAPQLLPSDMEALAAQGFVAIICNRPDGEETGQSDVDSMRAAAQNASMAFHHIPVSGGKFPQAAIAAFRAVRQGTQGNTLAYCRTGTRSITLETLANPAGKSAAERISTARDAGYDLSAFANQLGD